MQTNVHSEKLNKEVEASFEAFQFYKKTSLQKRAQLLKTIAIELEADHNELIRLANMETNLPIARLKSELLRTIFQLTSYADHCEKGAWLDARIDTGDVNRNPPKPDIRKTMSPLGPVVVFGSSNFPFAYSTAGGDTACALAAGCTVIVKAHPAHLQTGNKVALAIEHAIRKCNLPEDIFKHISGEGNAIGEMLVKHPLVKAVGFTGSFTGGKQLFDWGQQREEPIPVFAEMGSVNPVFILPEKLKEHPEKLADTLSESIVLGVGQFCTNPGIMVAIKNEQLELFLKRLCEQIEQTLPAAMLHGGIYKNYSDKKEIALQQKGVTVLAHSKELSPENYGEAVIAGIDAGLFLKNNLLQQEVFGPYSLVVQCNNVEEMIAVAHVLKGQLTATIFGTMAELKQFETLQEILSEKCGRFIWNGVPTGVEVCLAMHHGGPFPATTDSRFTSVGADGIKRFARPISFQNWPDELLPDELKNENPLSVWRMVNNEPSDQSLK